MSLINDYLKRLGGKSSSSAKRGEGVIPPALQRIQKGSMVKPSRKKYLLFAGIAVAVYFVGYFTVNMITLVHAPGDDETVTAEAPPVTSSATTAATALSKKTDIAEDLPNTVPLLPPSPGGSDLEKVTTTVMPALPQVAAEQRAEVKENRTPPATPEKKSAQGELISVAVELQDKTGNEKNEKLGFSRGTQKEQDRVVEQERDGSDSSGIEEEPYPLEGTASATTGTTTSTDGAEESTRNRIFTESENKPAYYYQIALQAQHNNNFGRAERYYQTLLEVEPEHENALINLAAIFILENRLSEADRLLQKALELNPKNSKALVNAGMIALHQKKNEIARDHFRQALKYNPIEETALINLAYLAQQKKQYDVAGAYYKKLTQITPDNTELLLTYAGLEEKQQQYTSAINLYRRCLTQMSMQRQPELYVKIKQRIQILRQYAAQQANKDFFKVEQ